MALTRKMLKALGIEDAAAEEIIEAHSETVDALKEQRDKALKDAGEVETLKKQLEAASASKSTDDEWKAKYEAEHEAFEAYKADAEKRADHEAREKAYREALREAGIDQRRHDQIVRIADLESLEMDGEGIKDKDSLVESLKAEWSDFIPTQTTGGPKAATPPATGKAGVTRESIDAIKDRGERQRAMAEHIDLYE